MVRLRDFLVRLIVLGLAAFVKKNRQRPGDLYSTNLRKNVTGEK